MKNIMGVIVVLLLFVVPLGSWYYLQSGLDYRKDALKELEPKESLLMLEVDHDLFQGHTVLVQLKEIDHNVLPAYYDQYKSSETFKLLSKQKPTERTTKWIELDNNILAKLSSQYTDASMILVDTALNVRHVYTSSPEDISKMIEHTAIVLPRVKERDIKMKK